ncbi:glycogen synthase [Cohnella sp. GCM10012308]|uniref:glycogen synthase n=1 Tax=Cohnella sp. GCM10012308 TaxID=3317329 RepID=UPI00362436B3
MSAQPAVLFVSTEVYPFAKTGGLADVSAFLPKALRARGCDIRIVMPKFRGIEERFGHLLRQEAAFPLAFAGRTTDCVVQSVRFGDNFVYLIDAPHYYDRERLYDYEDEMERFVFFSLAALEALPRLAFRPDIVHCNDWLTGFVPYFLQERYRQQDFFRNMRTIFTIHAMLYQGVFHRDLTKRLLGVEWDTFAARGLGFYGQINCMKVGILTADLVSTVSPSYAAEISKTSPLNIEPLTESLRSRRRSLTGILNGIDPEANDPSADPRLYAGYDAERPAGKAENKRRLQEALGLPVRSDVPVVAVVSRLEITKGLYLIEKSYHELLKDDLQFIVVGDGIPYYDHLFRTMQEAFPNRMRYLPYDETSAYRTYAAADLFLMPSYTEACGISQLIGMRYGAVPIIRETGGLRDTVEPYDPVRGTGTGFAFKYASQWVMLDAVRRAIEVYRRPDEWRSLTYRAMTHPVGWEQSTEQYLKLYTRAVQLPALQRQSDAQGQEIPQSF